MSEPQPLIGIVIAHGTLAEGLVDAVQQISGIGPGVLIPLSNRGLSPDAIADAVERAAAGRPELEEILTDCPPEDVSQLRETMFTFGLAAVLDGLEAKLTT